MSYEKQKPLTVKEEQKREREAEERRQACKRMREESHKNDKTLCRLCDFTGTIIAKKGFLNEEQKKLGPSHDTRESYSFRCTSCVAAEQMGIHESYPPWTYERAKEFDSGGLN